MSACDTLFHSVRMLFETRMERGRALYRTYAEDLLQLYVRVCGTVLTRSVT